MKTVLRLGGRTNHFVGFVMRWLNMYLPTFDLKSVIFEGLDGGEPKIANHLNFSPLISN